MTLKQVIDLVDDIEPNAYSSETKVAWLNECEGTIQTDIFLRAIDDVELYTWADDQQTVLLVKPPHDKLYRFYLQAMIQLANAEYDRYQNTMVLYDAAWGEYARWFGRTIYPAGRDAMWRGYYISAYGIAVQHGYHGTPEAWLASLKGENGEDAYEGAVEAGYEGTREDFFRILASVDALAQSASGSAAAAETAKSGAEQSAAAAAAALAEFTAPTATASTLSPGSPATASYANGNFAFGIPRGEQGETGTGISGITFVRTDAQGGNVYRITLTNGNTYEFTAPKGAAGEGSGDMLAADYDPSHAVRNAGGIVDYVDGQIPAEVTEQTVAGWGFTKNTGTYSKPSTGIPASDLASGVIPTVPTNVSAFTNDSGYLTLSTLPIYGGEVQ